MVAGNVSGALLLCRPETLLSKLSAQTASNSSTTQSTPQRSAAAARAHGDTLPQVCEKVVGLLLRL